MKPAPYRLELENYPRRTEVSTRYNDLDPMHHINNVAVGQFYEEARVEFFHDAMADGHSGKPLRTMVAEVSMQYLREGRHPGLLTVAIGVNRIGRTSFTFGQALFQNGLCIGTADVTQVMVDADGPAVIPETLRQRLETMTVKGAPAS